MTYLTHEELEITKKERSALITVMTRLITDRHMRLDMQSPCGTICCIGGYVANELCISQAEYMSACLDNYYAYNIGGGLKELYFGFGWHGGNISKKDAAIATYNFLTTGRPHWQHIGSHHKDVEMAAKQLRDFVTA